MSNPSARHRWAVRNERATTIGGDGRIVSGTAAGIAAMLRVEPAVVRLSVLVLSAAAGWGVLMYVAAWLWFVVGQDHDPPPLAEPDASSNRRDIGFALVALGILLELRQLDLGVVDAVVWPAALLGVGLATAWRRVGRSEIDAVLSETGPRPGHAGYGRFVRIGLGSAFAAVGTAALVGSDVSLSSATRTVTGLVIVGAGAVLVLGPNLRTVGAALTEERSRRIRADERARISRHIHDSVLQTLALIQKRATDETEVVALARSQERELRHWLYGSIEGGDRTARGLLEQAAAEVEDLHRVAVECVVVGDRAAGHNETEMVAAAREAMVNAAKFSTEQRISVYAEVAEGSCEIYVRDRGIGFDVASVDADRHGIAESIVGRMAGIGGVATIRSTPGGGTEVHLRGGASR